MTPAERQELLGFFLGENQGVTNSFPSASGLKLFYSKDSEVN
jgi:hypothetical protein